MKFIHLLLASAVALIPTPALAETWIANCNNVQFNFNRDSESYLVYFNTDSGIYQVAEGEITTESLYPRRRSRCPLSRRTPQYSPLNDCH